MHIRNLIQGRGSGILVCLLEILVGVLLLIDPVGFTSGIIIGAGVLLVLLGAGCIARYFMLRPETAAQRRLLFKGMLAVMGGTVCIVRHDWFLNAFPLLTVLYAIALLVLAAARLQRMADMCRMMQPRWFWPGISAGLAAGVAAILLINPFGAVTAVWTFAALALIAEGIVGLLAIIL